MKRSARITFEVVGPTLLTLLVVYALMAPNLVSSLAYGTVNAKEHLVILVGVCLVVGVPSILYTVIMEFAYARFIEPGRWSAVVLSTGLGVVAGLLMEVFVHRFFGSHDTDRQVSSLPVVVGPVFGFIIGATVRACAVIHRNRSAKERVGDRR